MDVSLNERLVLVALPAPYLDEKLSEWRGRRLNMFAGSGNQLEDWFIAVDRP